MQLKYDAVIATRNRPEALRLSLPLLISQGRKPARVIVVDASDNPAAVENVVQQVRNMADMPMELLSGEAGLPKQRNVGLQRVSADVVFFPDDDSLVLPGALEAMMRVYELDTEGLVGGVCSAEAVDAPENILAAAQRSYRMGMFDSVKRSLGKRRYALERQLVPDPFSVHAELSYDGRSTPAWFVDENAVLVPWMTGFRMSFRTELIRRSGFDETLGRYALFEDVEAGFAIMKTHLLVGARNARIYHHRMPGARGSGRLMGATQLLNRAYVLAKHGQPGSPAPRYLLRLCRYKLALYATRIDSQFGWDRLAGAWAAYRCIPDLLAAGPSELPAAYKEALRRSLGESAKAAIA